MSDQQIQEAYHIAKERYAGLGVDTDKALDALAQIPLSLHCWQGDDVGGFENAGAELSGGIAATGNYPGKARNADELRRDLDLAYRLIPGTHRLNLHALYAETGGKRVERNELRPEHFAAWIDWAKANSHAIDFNPSLFSHPKAASGFTLASYDKGTRKFWIEHCIACRKIGEAFGRELGSPCVTNIWIPDGLKDTPANRRTPRELLRQSLDTIFAEKIDRQVQSRFSRREIVWAGFGKLRRRFARILSRLRDHQGRVVVSRHGTLSPNRNNCRQDFGSDAVRERIALARQSRRSLGQRSRRHLLR